MFKHKVILFVLIILRIRTVICKMEGRVVDGVVARIQDFPHSVFLNADCTSTWTCGASILNQQILLTAAHCVHECEIGKKKKHIIEAFLGNADLRQVDISRLVRYAILHEEYDDQTIENDIAVVLLRKKIPLKQTMKRVIIRRYWTLETKNGVIAGWGVFKEIVYKSLQLISVSQKLRSPKTCALLGHLSPGMFCGGSTVGHHPRPASGDSGSALMYKYSEQIGIVSFKVKEYPALLVYTNVTYYYRWIKKMSQVLYCRHT